MVCEVNTRPTQRPDFVFKMMDFVFKMMDYLFKMMDFLFKIMDFLFKMNRIRWIWATQRPVSSSPATVTIRSVFNGRILISCSGILIFLSKNPDFLLKNDDSIIKTISPSSRISRRGRSVSSRFVLKIALFQGQSICISNRNWTETDRNLQETPG